MNRSFRASEGPTMRSKSGNSTRREKEEELTLFLEMQKREKERNSLLFQGSEDFEGSRPGNSALFNIMSSAPTRRTGTDDFLNSENDKNDYEWLITPPGTPLFPSLVTESRRNFTSPTETLKIRPTTLKSRLVNPQSETSTRTLLKSRQTTSSPGSNTSTVGLRRPLSSSGSGSRPSTPTTQPTSTSRSKPVSTYVSKSMSSKPTSITSSKSTLNVSKPVSRSSTPTSRPTLAPTSKPVSTYVSKPTSLKPTTITSSKSMPNVSKPPSRSSTPTSRPALPSTKAIIPPRSSTPTNRSTLVSSKPPSRSATPTRRSTTLTTSTNSCTKPSAQSAPPRASSLIVKPIPWNPSEMPGFSLSAPPNLRTSLPDKPLPATRGRSGIAARSSSIEPVSSERIRRQSCSPSRGRLPNGVKNSYGGSVPALSRIHAKANESVNPGLVGTKMVERVINMRRLIPPKRDDKQSPCSNLSGKSSSPDSSGFGRSFSKKSLDMAVRHMDLRKSIQGNMRRLMTNIPASSISSVRSGPTRSRAISILDSPLATSSNASSEVSVNNNGFCVNINAIENDINSDKGATSPASICGR